MLRCRISISSWASAVEDRSSSSRRRIVRKNVGNLVRELKACATARDLVRGRSAHRDAVDSGDERNIFVASGLIDMYAKCCCVHEARRVFEKIELHSRDEVVWNALILGYADSGDGIAALELFQSMIASSRLQPNSRTMVAAAKAVSALAAGRRCERLHLLESAMAIHSQAARSNCWDVFVASSVIALYAKLGSMSDARRALDRDRFPTLVAWNALLLGYAESDDPHTALLLLSAMSVPPNARSFVAALKACSNLGALEAATEVPLRHGEVKVVELKVASLETGMAVHRYARHCRFSLDAFVANSLIDMYATCGSMVDAIAAFEPARSSGTATVVTWNSLISGLAEIGDHHRALELFHQMPLEPDTVTFVAALKACAGLAARDLGRQLHARVCQQGLETAPLLATVLVDFYGKSGCMVNARQVFDSVFVPPDAVAWSSLMSGYSRQGDSKSAFDLLREMRLAGVVAGRTVLTAVLAACGHAGMLETGKACLREMETRYGVRAEREHYNCVVDLFGRAGEAASATEVAQSMPFEGNEVTRTMLLKWGDAEVAKRVFDERRAVSYVLLGDRHSAP